MNKLSKKDNKLFIAGENVLEIWDEGVLLQKIKSHIKNYFELDNVSFLFGAGSSINLGSISISTIPKSFEEKIQEIADRPEDEAIGKAYFDFLSIIENLQKNSGVKRTATGEIDYPIESLLNILTAIDFVQNSGSGLINSNYIKEIINAIKTELFKTCDLDLLPNNPIGLQADVIANLEANKYIFHEKFTKKILQRPLNLKRANIFTTNYDLAFDIAFDRLGVHYINGFSGFHKRTFRPETFNYDVFFPGSTTQGKVSRIEKVLRYYKIHGSLTWVLNVPSSENVYGIEEWPIDLVRSKQVYNELMIYPSSAKKSYTLDFPYSELFRQFSANITQQQSVLITFGYSFGDEHINDIIYQALTIPSFTLIIVDYNGTGNPGIAKLNKLKDPRIIIMEGNQLGSWPYFVEHVLPDFIEENIDSKIAQTLGHLYDARNRSEAKSVEDDKLNDQVISGNSIVDNVVPNNKQPF